ncbi:hypothetical protein CN692_11665 [Bacillus sp. AFS002410]|uniref:hypothetical protein n=1 Tax=Bacillus sp. AFS002410 TaxID=2033481 RepID=UPI000BF085A6|nr:hypothetical protein [Bacillus sp. AFS002410]PEJ57738.1 hypothetical protein CN692_11665 [Bacillus sp. AFS002410]
MSNQTTNNKEKDLQQILSDLNKQELITIILDLAEENEDIEQGLLYKYSTNEDVIAGSKKIIKEYINQAKYRGFIPWNKLNYALQGVYMTLDKARQMLLEEESDVAISLSLIILPEVIKMLNYSDDSGGYISPVISNSLDIIDEVAYFVSHLDESEQVAFFEKILKEAKHARYDDWNEWRFSLLECCIHFCSIKKVRNKLENLFEKLLSELEGSSWSVKNDKENIKLLQYQIIERFDGIDQAMQFVYKNVKLSKFREIAIEHLIQSDNYSEVLRLCEDGIIEDQELRGLVKKWKQFQLVAYENLGNKMKQSELLLEFIYNNKFEYYSKLKMLYQPDEWPGILEGILAELEKQRYIPTIYVEILIEEKMSKKLLQYCRMYISSVKQLYPHLVEEYLEETRVLFERAIEVEAEQAADRKMYKQVCKTIVQFNKIFGGEYASNIISNMKQKYVKKPAFIDELGKLK